MTSIFNSIKDRLYYLITGYMTKMGMIAWGGEIYNGPVSWDPSTWGTGTFTGGSGDSSGVFVPLADTIAAAAQAPSWLAPADYVSNGYTPEGVSTSIAPSNPYGGYSQAPAFLSPNDYFATGFSPSGANLNASPNITQSFGGLFTNAQGSSMNPYLQRQSQLSTNPDPKEAFNFVSNPYVNQSNSFSGPINNAIQSYLGRPATQAEIQQYSQQLAQNPDSYNTIVENIRNSAEADKAAKTGIQNLIFDPKQGDMTNFWLKASYGQYKPTDESFFSKLTNAVGSAIPYAGLGIMTGGLGSLAGLGGAATGALAGGVTGAARGAVEGGNVGSNALTGALLGGATGGALDFLGSSLPATSPVSSPLASSGGLDLGTGFTNTASNPYTDQFINAFQNPTISNAPGTLSADLGGGSYLSPSQGNNLSDQYDITTAILKDSTSYIDPDTGKQVFFELATPQASTTGMMGTGTEGAAQVYSAGSNEYIGLPDGTFIQSNTETGVEKIVDSLPKDAVPINAGNGANPVNGANTFANLTTGEILSGAGGAAALASLLNSLGVGSGGTGTGAGGTGAGTGGGGTGTGGGGTGTGAGGTGTGTGSGKGGTGTGGTGTGKGGNLAPKVPLALPKLLKNPVLYQSAPGGLYRGNQNPFTFGKDVPIQNPFASYDPFAALNVPQAVPKSDADLLANLLREHIYG